MQEDVSYPLYRKYTNEKSYFKILSTEEWEEIQFIGTKAILNSYKVNIFPDRNYINDLTFAYHDNWLKIDQQEYEIVKASL